MLWTRPTSFCLGWESTCFFRWKQLGDWKETSTETWHRFESEFVAFITGRQCFFLYKVACALTQGCHVGVQADLTWPDLTCALACRSHSALRWHMCVNFLCFTNCALNRLPLGIQTWSQTKIACVDKRFSIPQSSWFQAAKYETWSFRDNTSVHGCFEH